MADRDGISLPLVSWHGVSLTARILAVNVIVLGLIAASLFYLDSYRNQLLTERMRQARDEAEITAIALSRSEAGGLSEASRQLLVRIGERQHVRMRLYDARGGLLADSFRLSPQGPSFMLADPNMDSIFIKAARQIDRWMDTAVGAPPVPAYAEPARDTADAWPEIAEARASGAIAARQRYAPDRTPIITAAVALPGSLGGGEVLLTLRNDRDITTKVRDARQSLADVVGVALLVSIALSLFLARTIINPLRALVRAAVRVRLGRERAVVVPRLPERRDEIGLLARAFSDMTTALRQRIDAVEDFAADVAHEIKNPLASLRSALESLDKVDDIELRRQLAAIAAHDVQRIDRLVTEIADASRIDAELSRTTFEPVDLLALATALVGARDRRGANGHASVRLRHEGAGSPVVAGDPARLERVFENLLDNAVSFSPPGGAIDLIITSEKGRVTAEVADDGPGIPSEVRERVFERFHSLRPADEDFGRHSGLGLAIARTIIEAHDGTLVARDPLPPRRGARLVVDLPARHHAWGHA
jgi:two-component system sensor histidine kinase ChvG